MTDLLTVKDLCIEFDTPQGRKRVVDNVNFSVGPGEVLGILGESGSGKTLSTMAVLGLVSGGPGVVGGSISFNDGGQQRELLEGLTDVLKPGRGGGPTRKDNRRWRRMVQRRMRPIWGCGMTAIFQNPRHSLDPLMTIGAQVEESVALAFPDENRSAVRERSVRWLDKVQMNEPERVHRSFAHELSGGMCQRAMIAVALAREPLLLIADEPSTGLDTTVRAEIVALFSALLADRKRSMLYISHDIREVLYLSDRVIVMQGGHVIEEATAQALRTGAGERNPYTAMLLSAADLAPGEAA